MRHLNINFTEYLTIETNYAMLITGKWGVGKTYYYKHNLSKIIAETPTLADASKKYEPIHISLFGRTSIEDIQTEIFLSLRSFLKNKAFKLSAGLAKAIVRGMLKLKNLGNIDDYISDVKPDVEDWIELNQLVICFDDLERRSNNLPIEELIGFINDLVENSNAKIILIANEDKIKDNVYDDLKEKVIGINVEFIPDFNHNVQAIIQYRYAPAFSQYASFLTDHLESIIEHSSAIDSNLRILVFALDKLQTIHSEILTKVLDIPVTENHIIKEKLKDIIRFVLSISIEYRNREITYMKRNGIDRSMTLGSILDISDDSTFNSATEEDNKNENYKELFIEKYYKSLSEYKFFKSIYDYITGGSNFNITNLLEEIETEYHLENQKVLPQYEVLNKLNVNNYWNLNDREYNSLTRKMVNYAENGEYKIGDYLTVFGYATRLENHLNYIPGNLLKRFKAGIKKGKSNFTFDDHLSDYLDIPQIPNFKDELVELRQTILALNSEIGNEHNEIKTQEFLDLFDSDTLLFIAKAMENNGEWVQIPFFIKASPYKIYRKLIGLSGDDQLEFIRFLRGRYSSYLKPEFIEELPFFERLKDKLEPKSKARKKNTLKNHKLDFILKNVEEVIEKLKKLKRQFSKSKEPSKCE
ncbi:hypothetical protein QQ020_00395 [Fulvivirgaceae bacterium BMA12]|uniref:KAP NTPase domain-containing protein n=1 Tax=Agaribacillus aureus TaxID=3051825 RepID=A0ABT8KYB2_9BACT|nr:hypothetical protein [Fulvivirgaceae bacterium BMA12]